MNEDKQKIYRIIEMITQIGIYAEKKMQNTSPDTPQHAFLFGHLNMAAALTSAIIKNKNEIEIGVDYKVSLKAYQEAKKENKENKENKPQNVEELLPELLKLLELIENAFKDKDSNKYPFHTKSHKDNAQESTKKSKNTKEE